MAGAGDGGGGQVFPTLAASPPSGVPPFSPQGRSDMCKRLPESYPRAAPSRVSSTIGHTSRRLRHGWTGPTQFPTQGSNVTGRESHRLAPGQLRHGRAAIPVLPQGSTTTGRLVQQLRHGWTGLTQALGRHRRESHRSRSRAAGG